MKKIPALIFILCLAVMVSCNKSENADTNNFDQLKSQVLLDFTNVVAVPGYQQLDASATTFENSRRKLPANNGCISNIKRCAGK